MSGKTEHRDWNENGARATYALFHMHHTNAISAREFNESSNSRKLAHPHLTTRSCIIFVFFWGNCANWVPGETLLWNEFVINKCRRYCCFSQLSFLQTVCFSFIRVKNAILDPHKISAMLCRRISDIIWNLRTTVNRLLEGITTENIWLYIVLLDRHFNCLGR